MDYLDHLIPLFLDLGEWSHTALGQNVRKCLKVHIYNETIKIQRDFFIWLIELIIVFQYEISNSLLQYSGFGNNCRASE